MKKFKYFTKPEFTVAETELKIHKKTGLGYRPNTSDAKMLNDCVNNYVALPLAAGDVVFDLGANIGGFIKQAIDVGITEIYAWEPDQFNFDLLQENCKNWPEVQLYKQAMVSDADEKPVTFVIKDNANGACSGTVNETKNESAVFHKQTVNTTSFHGALQLLRPNVLKIDIEGGEYDIMDRPLPNFVRYVAFELHGMNKISYLKMLKLFRNMIRDGWLVLDLDLECFFGGVQLINVVFERAFDNQPGTNYDFTGLDALKARSIRYDKLIAEDVYDLNTNQQYILLMDHISDVNELCPQLSL